MRLSGTKLSSISQSGGLGNQLWDLSGTRPSLDLPFSDTKSLVDTTTGKTLIDFTRASSGTYVDSDGLIKTATTNLLLRSEEFDDAGWDKSNITVVPNTTTAPDGTFTADQVSATTAATGRLYQDKTVTAGVTYTASIYVKAGTSDYLLFREDAEDSFGVGVDLTTGQVLSGSGTIEPLPNGWYRISFSGSVSGTTFRTEARTSSTDYFYVWGAQLEQSSTVGEYIPTTSTINSAPRFDHDPTTGESLGLLVEESRTNLLLRSEEFDDASWTKTGLLAFGSGSVANAAIAPDGSLTADLLTESTASGSQRNLYQSAFTASPATLSCYVKANGRNFVGLRFYNSSSNWVRVTFSLTGLGTATDVFAGTSSSYSATSASISLVGDGWYRVSLTATKSSGINFAVLDFATTADPALAPTAGTEFYTGDGTSGLYLWGAQLEQGSFPTSYIPTEGSTVTRAADVASISGSNFSSWYRQDEGTVFADSQRPVLPTASEFPQVFFVSDGTGDNAINLGYLTATNSQFRVRRLTSNEVNLFSSAPELRRVTAGAYAANDAATSEKGSPALGDTSVVLPSALDQLNIGSTQSGSDLNGTIRRLTYWPARLPNETLQIITQ